MEQLNFFQPILMAILLLFSMLGIVGCGPQMPKPGLVARANAGVSSGWDGTASASYTYASCLNDCVGANGTCPDTCSSQNGCTTGRRTFTSFTTECTGLQSESLNNSCDPVGRRTMFQSYACPGTFTPTN